MTDEEIIEEAKVYIDTQGKANITWLLGDLKRRGKIEDNDNNNNRADNIACQMERTNVYVIYFLPTDLDQILVKRNPNFELNENIKKTNVSVQNLNDRLVTFNKRTILVAAFTGIFIAGSFFKNDGPKLQPTNKLLEQIVISQDSIKQYQKGIDSSLMIMADSISMRKSF